MIREYRASDINDIMQIWLEGNKQAHSFIPKDYFEHNYDLVASLIPSSQVFVQDLNGVKGFIGLMDNYIAGLFVDKNHQRQGTGVALIQKAKQLHNDLSVHVYQKNESALEFYRSQGFNIVEESINPDTNEKEYLLTCKLEHKIKIGKCAL